MNPASALTQHRRAQAGPPIGRRVLVFTLATLAALLIWDLSGLDLTISRALADVSGFPLRQHWLFSWLLHDVLRVVSGLLVVALVVNMGWPLIAHIPTAARVDLVVASLSAAMLVPAFKRFSATSCPWHLAEFGGQIAYIPHWLLAVTDGGPGHCFPSGHVVSAFAFFAGWLVLRDLRPRVARLWLFAVLLAGTLAGAAQVIRGAHYVSHVLWSAWLCWVVTLIVLFALRQVRQLPAQR
jgi:membrane-associated PAP2 superfamily phosphatase